MKVAMKMVRDREKELYKCLFEMYYSHNPVPHLWMPQWSPETEDPSARTLENYCKNVGS